MLERPWARVKTAAELPQPLTGETLAVLPDEDFATLLRDHLLPRDTSVVGRAQWDRLWVLLAGDDALAERAYDVLEAFMDAIERARADGSQDERDLARMEKYGRTCAAAWNRLESLDRPLGWAGRRARAFNQQARRVIDELVQAIAEHRREVGPDGTAVDEQLWDTLQAVGLDPELHDIVRDSSIRREGKR